MNQSIWQAIATTPWWVFLLYYYLLFVAYQLTKPRIVHSFFLIILPGIFIILLLVSLLFLIEISLHHLLILFIAICCGMLLGWLQFRLLRVKAIKDESKFYMPGSFSALILVALLIIAKYYYYGSQLIIDTRHLIAHPNFPLVMICLSGLSTGLYIGRVFYLLRATKVGPYHL